MPRVRTTHVWPHLLWPVLDLIAPQVLAQCIVSDVGHCGGGNVRQCLLCQEGGVRRDKDLQGHTTYEIHSHIHASDCMGKLGIKMWMHGLSWSSQALNTSWVFGGTHQHAMCRRSMNQGKQMIASTSGWRFMPYYMRLSCIAYLPVGM